MNTPATWTLVDSWATKCSASSPSHIRCHQNIELATSGVPKRLIDVAAKTASGLRLSVSASERMPLPYLTLSYTWGDVHPDTLPLLRKTSIADYTREIPEDCLPILFQEAVHVTRRLGYRYLWIDAFCILQDDPDDFQTEAALMGEIYQKAVLNIAAGGASNSSEPLMRARDPSLVNPCKVEVDWSNLATSLGRQPHQIRLVGSFYIFDGKYTEGQIVETSLNRRAWVLQEQELSPRILHFGRHQMFWQCWGDADSAQACEAFPKGTPMALGFERAHQKGLVASLLAEERQKNAVDLYLYWHSLVQAYSRCGITRKTDKLVALTGIAQKYALALQGDVYVAGLWQSQLIIELCWEVDTTPLSGSPQSERYESEVAPSWSWASVSGYIKLVDGWFLAATRKQGMTILPLANVEGVALRPLIPRNPFGQLEYGRIRLSGYMVHDVALEWLLSQSKNTEYGHRSKGVVCVTPTPRQTFMGCNFDDEKDLLGRDCRRIRFTFYHKITGIHLIPLIHWKHPSDPKESFIEGIMVVSSDIEENAFRRVGHFRSADHVFNDVGNEVDHLFFHMQENAGIVLV
jgi:hypothetical protein